MIVDDDAASRYLLRELLAETRFEIAEAGDGERGIELARSLSPAAIFLDLQMPGLRGEEVLARLRADPATRSVPVIVYSALALDEAARTALAAATAILSKEAPSRAVALKQIRDALGRAARRGTGATEWRSAP